MRHDENKLVRKRTRRTAVLVATAFIVAVGSASGAPNDPHYAKNQWGLQKVGAEFAWQVTTGQGTLIAIVDTGIFATHEDLAGKVVGGRDFVANDDDAKDEHGHGTLVAGIAAATTANGKGIAAVAPDAQLLSARVFDSKGSSEGTTVAAGIDWAVEQARSKKMPLVLNLSFVKLPDDSNPTTSEALLVEGGPVDRAIERAAAAGAAVVVASGNDGAATTSYDSTSAGVIVVGASDKDDRRAGFTSYGAGLDIVAPGVEIASTYWSADNPTASIYAFSEGTSLAVPFVVGAASLLMAPCRATNTTGNCGLSNERSIQRLKETAKDLGTAGRDDQHGHGLLDVAAAAGVSRTRPSPSASPSAVVAAKPSPSPTPSPSPLVLPPPGEPPELLQPAFGSVDDVKDPQPQATKGEQLHLPSAPRSIAGLLVLLVAAMHIVRKALLT